MREAERKMINRVRRRLEYKTERVSEYIRTFETYFPTIEM